MVCVIWTMYAAEYTLYKIIQVILWQTWQNRNVIEKFDNFYGFKIYVYLNVYKSLYDKNFHDFKYHKDI